ncbi:hypothetical protein [Yinghuangia seranimata]|uniref:hypothetical protein n=1 Tax=Yinghuangia seranimata TaxID=408067 RepID=UPI00248B0D29|nr:hypothetical protein [Yinghuangia seranimata]MDI2131194.1 hypothetical protein [Yinghuangia seranimata]
MTVGNEGEPDDPYGYLYRPGPGDAPAGSQSAPAGFGTSPYVQVGQTRYGQPPPPYVPSPDAQATQAVPGVHPDQQQTVYQPAQPGGPGQPPAVPGQRREGGGHGSGGSRGGRGPVIGAVVAIVVVIAVIAAVMALNGGGDDKKKAAPPPSTPPGSSAASSAPPSSAPPSSAAPTKFGETEAETAQLAGGAVVANNAQKFSGSGFVAGLTQPGASITVSFDAPSKGSYSLYVLYANPDPTSTSGQPNRPKKTMTVVANGSNKYGQINLYGTGSPDSWYTTYRTIDLNEGPNTVTLACQPGDSCNVTVDKMWVGANKSS